MAVAPAPEGRIGLFSPLVPDANGIGNAPDARWDRLADDLKRIAALPADWDGQGAQAPSSALIERAERWVGAMRSVSESLPPTGVVPGPDGEIVLEWRGAGYYLAAEVAELSRTEWSLRGPDDRIEQWQTDANRLWVVRSGR